jgi:hypothetical protein
MTGHGATPLAAVTLPRPDIVVTTDSAGKTQVEISRKASDGVPLGKRYDIAGTTPEEKIKDAGRQITDDAPTAEWLP